MDTTVSIGMPVYNSERVLRAALDSLRAQSYQQFEIVISDNASTDGTAEICREYAALDSRVKYFRNEHNIGAIRNFRRVLDLSTGKYFTWASADDERPARAIEECVDALEREPESVMAHGPVEAMLPEPPTAVVVANAMDLSDRRVDARVRTFTERLEHNAILYGVYRRAALTGSRLGDHFGHDYLFCLNTCVRGPFAYVSAPLIRYQHRNNAIESPMYDWLPPSLRDLVFYRGVRRYKCWLTLVLGCCYLYADPTLSVSTATRASLAHFRSFVARYPRHLVTEVAFLAFTPVYFVMAPLRPASVKAAGVLKRHGLLNSAADRARP
jgi:glycosyltransferase involved in cell wall biosynthesis